MHLSSIKLKTKTDINSVSENKVLDNEISEQSKPINQIKNIYQEEKSKPEIHKEIKSEKKIFINNLEKLIQTCIDKKEIKLKYELEKNVNLVKFEKNMIEISFNENLDKNFVKELSSKLFDWTGERWMISFSQLKGEISIKEKKQKIKKSLIDGAKSLKIYKEVIKNFPDAELIDVNLKGEDEPSD
jgi:DNA polymerase-3 subunit gamma/tau